MVRIRGNPYELSFRHYTKNDPEIMGIQRSRRGKRAFHFCVPGTDTHLRGGRDAPVVTGTSNTSSEKKWCWLASDQFEPEEWQPYPDKLQGYLDRACMSDSMRIRVRIGGRPYIIDLMSRAQISELSGSVRQIKKMVVPSAVAIASPVVTPTPTTTTTRTPVVPATGTTNAPPTTTTNAPPTTTTTTTAGSKPQQARWQWNSGSKSFKDWKDYDSQLNVDIEKAY